MIYLSIPSNAGMGNQLFMLAYGYNVSVKQQQRLVVLMGNDERIRPLIYKYLKIKNNPKITWININCTLDSMTHGALNKCARKIFRTLPVKNRHVVLKNARKFNECYLVPGSAYIEGYWENYKYFAEVEREIKMLFEMDYPINRQTRDLLDKISDCDSVALHVRMGDFVKLGRSFDLDYYDNAIAEMKKRIPKAVFFLVTTDSSVREHFANCTDVVIVDINTDTRDLDEWNILCHCKNHITTNSTYSWWAAILCQYSDKVVFKPSRSRYSAVEGEEYGKNYDDFYPDSWIDWESNYND